MVLILSEMNHLLRSLFKILRQNAHPTKFIWALVYHKLTDRFLVIFYNFCDITERIEKHAYTSLYLKHFYINSSWLIIYFIHDLKHFLFLLPS